MARVAPILLILAAFAVAEERMTLVLKDGKKRSVTVTSFDERGVRIRKGSNEEHVAWSELTNRSAFDARKALTPFDDAAGRVALSAFAFQRKLFPEALEELEIGLALGAISEADFEKREREIEKAEIDYLRERIDDLLRRKEDPATCLAAIKRLRERYPEDPRNSLYEPHVKELVEKLAQKVETQQAAEKAAAEDAEIAGIRKTLDRLIARKDKALAKAQKLQHESVEAIEKRQVSRVKKKLVEPQGAEKYFKQARQYLTEMAKADRKFKVVTEQALQKEYDAIADELVKCYLDVARILLKERNYKGTIPYVRKILYYDPINEEALEMVETIRKNRIHFKTSDITNARPRVSGH